MKNDILIIQSDNAGYLLLKKYLVNLDYITDDIKWYATPAEAFTSGPENIGLIFVDVSHCASDSNALQQIRKNFPGIPVIALSDTDDTEKHINTIRDGAQEFLVNCAFDQEQLSKTIALARMRKGLSLKIRNVLDDYQRHFENGPIPMWIVDTKTMKFCIVNNAAVSKYGYSKEEFARMSLVDIRPKEDIGAMMDSFNHREGIYFDAGYWRHVKKNGEVFYVHIYSHATVFEQSPARLSFMVDVNEKVMADKQNRELNALIKEQKEQLDGILYSISDAIWARRADNNDLVYANRAYYNLYDYTPENIQTDNDYILNSVFPDDRALFLNAMKEVREVGHTEIVYRYNHTDGSIKTLKANATYKKGVDGKMDMINGITIDISKEKELYDTIRNSEHKLLSTINNTTDLIWSVNADLKLIFCNKPYQDFFYKAAGVVLDEGDYALGSWHTEAFITRRKQEYERALNGESFTTVIEENRDGGVHYNEISSNPILDHHGKIIGVNCIARDITEPRRQLLKIQQQNEMLKEIAWIQSHKVRGPVASILGLLSLIPEGTENQKNAEILAMLRTATLDLDNIIREVVAKTNEIDYSYTYLPSLKSD